MLKLLTLWLVLPLVALASIAACSPTATLNVLASNDSHSFTGGVAYGPLARQKLDIYQPSSAAPAGGWPTVVFFYGGSWNSGERAAYRFVAEALAARIPGSCLHRVPDSGHVSLLVNHAELVLSSFLTRE